VGRAESVSTFHVLPSATTWKIWNVVAGVKWDHFTYPALLTTWNLTETYFLAILTYIVKYTMMLDRIIKDKLHQALGRQAAVALLGPRQVGKTTLALQVAEGSV